MSTPMNALPEVPLRETRPMYWSVRRELWENRSLYLAPLIVAAVFLFGFLISTFSLQRRMRDLAALDAGKQRELVMMPYNAAAGLLAFTAFIVGVFYCLDALHGERRDRSILFWKSLPVSDRTTVLSKASIPLVVLPLFVLVLASVLRVVVLLLSNAVLMGNRPGLALLWTHVKFFQTSIAFVYALIAIALWHAPVYAWLLLISAWSRRAAVLWAVLPLAVIAAMEKVVAGTSHFGEFLKYRLIGWLTQAFTPAMHGRAAREPLMDLTPGRFLMTPGLWLGLIFAAVCLAAAVRLRRNREPI